MLDWILKLFLPNDLILEVSPEEFVFRSSGEPLSVRTQLTVSRSAAGTTVIAVGESVARGPDEANVSLFSGRAADLDRMELLEAVCRYGLAKLRRQKRAALVRPRIVVRGAESLDRILNGFQYGILRVVLTNGGARSVSFSDRP